MIKTILNGIIRFFPVQLLFLHLKKSLIQLFIWFLLAALISGLLAKKYGINYLFVTPEYLDDVGIWSFILVGLCFGLFIISFHISCYVRYSFRFPFLATLNRAFFKFSLNNSLVPIVFMGGYIYYMVMHLRNVSGLTWPEVGLLVGGFTLGTILMVSVCFTYFFTVNRGLVKYMGKKLDKPLQLIVKKNPKDSPFLGRAGKVTNTYLKTWIKIARVRPSDHYSVEKMMGVFQLHHRSAAFFTLLIFCVILTLSYYRETPEIMIPAAASIFLLASMFMLLTGALFTWFKGWTTTVIIAGLIILNVLSSLIYTKGQHFAYGMDYTGAYADYSYEKLDSITSFEILKKDKQHMLYVLENWKEKNTVNGKKPKIVFLNTSGGGLRSTVWAFDVIQFADSLSEGALFNNTHLITGSSGGMIGAAYYRELALKKARGERFSLFTDSLRKPLTRDILNPVTFSWAVNDLFIKLLKFEDMGQKYPKDRGYSWEDKLVKNTGFWEESRLGDYQQPEEDSEVPLMILSPSLINEGRRLLISPQPISYLSMVFPVEGKKRSASYDGIEFNRLFREQQSDSIRFTTALRMSATFPFITPLIGLPSNPPIRTIDAGVRDNTGYELSLRFLYNFKEWIRENTSGVVFIQIQADRPSEIEIKDQRAYSAVDNLTKPILGVYNGFINMQAFQQEYLKQLTIEWADLPVDYIHFQLLEEGTDLSLSWHLTEPEKRSIYNSMYKPHNWSEFYRLKKILKD